MKVTHNPSPQSDAPEAECLDHEGRAGTPGPSGACEVIMFPRHARVATNGKPKKMKESKPELEAEAGNPDEPFDDDIPY